MHFIIVSNIKKHIRTICTELKIWRIIFFYMYINYDKWFLIIWGFSLSPIDPIKTPLLHIYYFLMWILHSVKTVRMSLMNFRRTYSLRSVAVVHFRHECFPVLSSDASVRTERARRVWCKQTTGMVCRVCTARECSVYCVAATAASGGVSAPSTWSVDSAPHLFVHASPACPPCLPLWAIHDAHSSLTVMTYYKKYCFLRL